MKGLNGFVNFDSHGFFNDKQLVVKSISEWRDFKSKEVLGTNLEIVIMQDNTKYITKNGEQISNMYEKFVVKVAKSLNDVKNTVAINSMVTLINPTATIYGEYRNQLSVKCSDIKVVKPAN